MAGGELPPRTGAVMCPDWPVVAALSESDSAAAAPAAVMKGHRVVGVSVSARSQGVQVGMRQRDAQAACPELVLLEHDPGRDTRLFEPIIAAVEDLIAGVAVIRPGLAVFAASSPVRYFGSEDAVAERLLDNIAAMTDVEAFVGFAEGIFAAAIAAIRQATVPPGQTRAFLADRDIAVLGMPQLISVLRRCGIHTLGAIATLPEQAVVTRFGAEGVVAYRLATAAQETQIVARAPETVLEVRMELDPPADRIQYATAAIHTAAERFHNQVHGRGLVCTVLRIDATTTGEQLSRAWRADDVFNQGQVATRLRWQLEAWLTSSTRPTAGISVLALLAEQVAPASSRQLGLWGDTGDKHTRAAAAIDRVQDLLGIAAVTTAAPAGGRLPWDQTRHVVWRDEPAAGDRTGAPWPDRVPAPIQTFLSPIPVALRDCDGAEVQISSRHLISAAPSILHRPNMPEVSIIGWAGPWAMYENWWEPTENRHGAWAQIVVTDSPGVESALLLFYDRRWWLVGCYD